MSSVPVLHENILLKFDVIHSMLHLVDQTTDLYDELIEKKLAYISSTAQDLQDYFKQIENHTKTGFQNATEQYNKHLLASGIIQSLDQMVTRITSQLGNKEELQEMLQRYREINMDIQLSESRMATCPKCKIAVEEADHKMEIDETTSEFVCHNCGHIQKLYGEVFADEQFYYQEGQRNKHGKYDPTKHCKFWIERIQAKENISIPDDVINKIKRCMRRDNMYVDTLSCETIRGYLKQLKLTNYNNNVPLIRKIITRREPAEFTERELKLIYKYFGIVIDIFNKIKSEDKSNCPYHPYFIYKIVEQIMYKPDDLERKKEILASIHLQSRETLNDNDKTWFEICHFIPEFHPSPTAR